MQAFPLLQRIWPRCRGHAPPLKSPRQKPVSVNVVPFFLPRAKPKCWVQSSAQETVLLHPEVVPWPYLVLAVSQEKGPQSPAKVLRAPESSPEAAHPSTHSLGKGSLPKGKAGKLMRRDTSSLGLQSGSVSKGPFCSFSLSSGRTGLKDSRPCAASSADGAEKSRTRC